MNRNKFLSFYQNTPFLEGASQAWGMVTMSIKPVVAATSQIKSWSGVANN